MGAAGAIPSVVVVGGGKPSLNWRRRLRQPKGCKLANKLFSTLCESIAADAAADAAAARRRRQLAG